MVNSLIFMMKSWLIHYVRFCKGLSVRVDEFAAVLLVYFFVSTFVHFLNSASSQSVTGDVALVIFIYSIIAFFTLYVFKFGPDRQTDRLEENLDSKQDKQCHLSRAEVLMIWRRVSVPFSFILFILLSSIQPTSAGCFSSVRVIFFPFLFFSLPAWL